LRSVLAAATTWKERKRARAREREREGKIIRNDS
jgi:hypothetical protein